MSEELTTHTGPRIIDAVVIRPPGHELQPFEELQITDYKDYQLHVEGWIEAVYLTYTPNPHNEPFRDPVTFTMWVNEEYLYKFDVEDWNFTATSVAASCGRSDLLTQGVLGPAIFTGPSDDEGETLPIPAVITRLLKGIHDEITEEVMS